MASHNQFKLTGEERSSLKAMISKGKHSSREIKRAWVLLKVDEGQKKLAIAQELDVAYSTIFNLLNAYKAGGLDQALYDAPRSGPRGHVHAKAKARITALACSQPPEGHEKWTLRLLADKAVELGLVEKISHEHVRRILKKTR